MLYYHDEARKIGPYELPEGANPDEYILADAEPELDPTEPTEADVAEVQQPSGEGHTPAHVTDSGEGTPKPSDLPAARHTANDPLKGSVLAK